MNPRVCHECQRRMEHPCGNTASTERRRVPGGTIVASHRWHGRRGISHPARTLSSLRAAADRVRALVLTPDSESSCERTPRAASARSDGQPITRSSFSRPSLHQMAWKSVRSIARVCASRDGGEGGAAAHHQRVWGNTAKPRCVSHSAAWRASARPQRAQQLFLKATLSSFPAPVTRRTVPADCASLSGSPEQAARALCCA